MTAKAPVKESTARRMQRIYRWLFVQGDVRKPITNVSVSSYFQAQNNMCALERLQTTHSHLSRMFIFAAMKY